MSDGCKTILSLQSFYGGSHRQFIDEWISASRLCWDQLTLPDRHWKWRMRHSAIEFSKRVDELWRAGKRWDAIFATDMLNVAEFRGMTKTDAARIPILTYFHENQFEYPNTEDQPRDLHFPFTNVTTALASEQLWFNSNYNFESFLGHLKNCMKKWPDFRPDFAIDEISRKSSIEHPGIELGDASDASDTTSSFCKPGPVQIVWAARWEHDKNPELLLEILAGLKENRVPFEVSVIGNQFSQSPEAFETIRHEFSEFINVWGFQDSRESYFRTLQQADVFLSTANHEFFGLSTVEAIASACIPVLPNRLVYPELLNINSHPNRSSLLYNSATEAIAVIAKLAKRSHEIDVFGGLVNEFRQKYNWETRAAELDNGIESFIEANNTIANVRV